MKLSLIIPCFNEEECIEKFFAVASSVFKSERYSTEYIFVDDGSQDNTLRVLKRLYKNSDEKISIISLSRNFGKESALYAGLKASKGDYVCFIDADLQQRPELAAKMVSLLDKYPEYDCIGTYAKRKKEDSKFSVFVKSKFYRIISKMSHMDFAEDASDFRCFRRTVANAILEMSEYHRFTKGLFAWVGFNTKYLPYEVQQRVGGESKWSFVTLFKYALEGIISFSVLPLRFPFYLGGLLSAFGFFYLLFYLIFTLAGHQSSSPLAIVIALLILFTGIILLAIGIVGEYIGKIHFQSKRRPVYIKKESYTPANRKENIEKILQQEEYDARREEKIKEKKEKTAAEKKIQQQQKQEMLLKANEQDYEEEKKPKKEKKKKKKKKSAPENADIGDDMEKIYETIEQNSSENKEIKQ